MIHTNILVSNYHVFRLKFNQWSIIFVQPLFYHMYLVLFHPDIQLIFQPPPLFLNISSVHLVVP